jgi:hypothetical protein
VLRSVNVSKWVRSCTKQSSTKENSFGPFSGHRQNCTLEPMKKCKIICKFFSWVRVYRSDDGPKNGRKLLTFVIDCFVHDRTPLDIFIDNFFFIINRMDFVYWKILFFHKSKTLWRRHKGSVCPYPKHCGEGTRGPFAHIQTMKAYGRSGVWLQSLFRPSLCGGEWRNSRSGCFTPGKVTAVPIMSEGGPQSRSGGFGEERDVLPVPGLEHQNNPWRLNYLYIVRPVRRV